MKKKVLVKQLEAPAQGNLDNDIDFICKSFGFFTLRDKQDSAGKIFRLLVKKTCGNEDGMRSDDIAQELDISRGAIVHHLNAFISTGLVVKEGNLYQIRSMSLQKSIEEVKDDIDRIFNQIAKIAIEVDERLGNYYR